MPRGPLDILKQVLGMHAQVVTETSLATSGQLTIKDHQETDMGFAWQIISKHNEILR